jgi:hypothetical protein
LLISATVRVIRAVALNAGRPAVVQCNADRVVGRAGRGVADETRGARVGRRIAVWRRSSALAILSACHAFWRLTQGVADRGGVLAAGVVRKTGHAYVRGCVTHTIRAVVRVKTGHTAVPSVAIQLADLAGRASPFVLQARHARVESGRRRVHEAQVSPRVAIAVAVFQTRDTGAGSGVANLICRAAVGNRR